VICGIGVILAPFAAAQALSDSANGETFSLTGTVVNSVTGAPVARALVRIMGSQQRDTFSDGDGHFQIDGMQAGRVMVMAQKPGYVNQQSAAGFSPLWVEIGPNTGSVALNLAPQSAIYGRVIDASGQPIEHIPLRLTARSLREGRRLWEQRGMAESDEDGSFRFANLMPGTYHVAAGPMVLENELLPAGEHPKTGFPHVYYPGVPEIASASPVQLGVGQQMEADFSLSTVPVYQVSGRVAGHVPDQGVGFQVLSASGDDISLQPRFNMETGTFKLEGVPAGSYLVRARSGAGGQPLRGEVRLRVTSNIDEVWLALAPTISIPVHVRLEARNPSDAGSSASGPQQLPVSVRLWPLDPNTAESFSRFDRSSGRPVMVFQNVDPGKYTAILTPQPPWYVQSASYGQTNLLTDDLSVASGQSYPMEIVLRNDGASLSGTVRSGDAGPAPAMVVIVSRAAGKVSPRVIRSTEGDFNASGLAPGDYLVFAFDQLGGLEYTNPDALEPYASQAAHVTLSANQAAQVSLDLIHVQKGD
jgi:hypothetical protein